MAQIPDVLPVFSLPNLVLLPGSDLPVRIFDPAYVAMFKDIIEGDRMVLVCQMTQAWEEGQSKTPELYDVGCIGVVTTYNELEEGYTLFLRGLQRVNVLKDVSEEPYRRVQVEMLQENDEDQRSELILELRSKIMAKLLQTSCHEILGPFPDGSIDRLGQASASNFVALLPLLLKVPPHDQQRLLELNGLTARLAELTHFIDQSLLKKATLGEPPLNEDGEYTH